MAITKSGPRLLANLIFFYGAVFALVLTGIGLANGFSGRNILTTILFLPVTLFFLYEMVSKFSRSYRVTYKLVNQSNYFSLSHFFAQSDPLFTINAILLTLALSTILIRQSLHIVLPDTSANLTSLITQILGIN